MPEPGPSIARSFQSLPRRLRPAARVEYLAPQPVPHALIVFSTVDGHTLKICQRMQRLLEARSHEVTLVAVDDAIRMDCSKFDKIVVGASIRYGKHRPSLYEFVAQNREHLGRVPNAFFSVSAVARKPGKDTPDRNPYFKTFKRLSGWSPNVAATFGGKIDYSKYPLFDRLMIQVIMAVTGGPTDPQVAVEFTDWDAVEAFAEQVSRI